MPLLCLDGQPYKIKHQWVELKESKGALLSMYTIPGELNPLLVVTQGSLPHTNLPPHASGEPVEFEFTGRKVEGELNKIELAGVKYMLTWQNNGFYFSCGGPIGQVTNCSRYPRN